MFFVSCILLFLVGSITLTHCDTISNAVQTENITLSNFSVTYDINAGILPSNVDNCRQYMSCPVCFEDPQCGWCDDYNLCINGNATGPDEGSCNWFYYFCPNSTTPTPTISPYNGTNTSWYQYGGNAQHTGYANYTHTITSNSRYTQIFNATVNVNSNYYSSALAIANDTVYFHLFSPSNDDYLHAWSIPHGTKLWSTQMLNYQARIDYSSAPSLTRDGRYIVSLCAGTSFEAIFQTLVDAKSGKEIAEQNGGYWYKGEGQTWSVIAAAVADDLNAFLFASSNFDGAWAEGWSIDGFSTMFETKIYDAPLFSYSPAYYDGFAYYHVGNKLIKVNSIGTMTTMYSGSEIQVLSANINSTITISIKNKILFVVGEYLCAFSIISSDKLWCNEMNGGSYQGTTPAVDDDDGIVYIYDDGYIYGYYQIQGIKQYTFGDGNIDNVCSTVYGCVSSQPIITVNTIFWADGINVLVFDKRFRTRVLTIANICDSLYGVGNSIAWYNDYLFVSCRDKIAGYAFA